MADDHDIEVDSYTYSRGTREKISGRQEISIPEKVEQWLNQTHDNGGEQRQAVSSQLEALEYI